MNSGEEQVGGGGHCGCEGGENGVVDGAGGEHVLGGLEGVEGGQRVALAGNAEDAVDAVGIERWVALRMGEEGQIVLRGADVEVGNVGGVLEGGEAVGEELGVSGDVAGAVVV